MGLFNSLFGDNRPQESANKDWDCRVFDTDRFTNRKSSNWVDWEDVATRDSSSDGFEHPYLDDAGEW